MPLVQSLTRHSHLSRLETSFATFSQVAGRSPTPTLSEHIGVSDVTPSVTGPLTMTEIIKTFMEDLLTQEFSPIVLDEDI